MTLQDRAEFITNQEICTCRLCQTDWCSYCLAVQQLSEAISEEREACAKMVVFISETEEDTEFDKGFNTACRAIAAVIRTRPDIR